MVFPRTLCDDISSSDFGSTDKASFSFSFSFLCLAMSITGLELIFLVVAVAFPCHVVEHRFALTFTKQSCNFKALFTISQCFRIVRGDLVPAAAVFLKRSLHALLDSDRVNMIVTPYAQHPA
ncbi:hypothetical protein AVEN_205103-1 [Araneus ventricosus]|uniref:Uncharacterized protein n=1 Tax=Araneus ventricosus TaxID=182803 RepID=A0A4Y2N0I8_ARAVE|nr:hypothetical protein AVEN_205103-1 [Araneus ventricosus]